MRPAEKRAWLVRDCLSDPPRPTHQEDPREGPPFPFLGRGSRGPTWAGKTAYHQVPILAKRPLIPIWLQKFPPPLIAYPPLGREGHGSREKPRSGRGHPWAVGRVGLLTHRAAEATAPSSRERRGGPRQSSRRAGPSLFLGWMND